VTRIDTPQLDGIYITFFSQIDFDCPRLAQFINRTPTLRARDKAHVQFGDSRAVVALLARSRTLSLEIEIIWTEPDRLLSSVAQVCNSSLHHLSTVEDLYIERRYRGHLCKFEIDAIKNTHWLQLFLPFTAVENLYLSKEFASGVAVALQELVGARITEVLPGLQNIFVEGLRPSGPVQENIEQFVAARRHSDHPIALSNWDKDSDMMELM
jgi:hypothetical protein